MTHIKGILERIVFLNPENGYGVLRVKDSLGKLQTLVGFCPPLAEGQSVFADVLPIEDKKWGTQYKIEKIIVENPKTSQGIFKFLSSGFLPGIGESYAQKIVDLFGSDSLNIISDEPARLTEISGLGIKRAMKASRALREQGAHAEVMSFLQSHGMGTSKAKKLVEMYGLDTIKILKSNPYRLVGEVEGLGFKTVDELALQLGIKQNAPERIEAALYYILQQASQEGHLYLPEEELLKNMEALLSFELEGIPSEALLNREGDKIYLPFFHRLESEVADLILGFHQRDFHPLKDELLEHFENKFSLELSDGQRKALILSLQNKLSVITGGPGTGKSTLTKILVAMVAAQGKRIALCAPTGRAAQRLEELCGREASTVHRLLKYDPVTQGFQHHKENPLEVDFLLCDESSMLDLTIVREIFRALPLDAQIVFVGDRDQLPPVGAGHFFHDLIECDFAVSKLDKIYRQKAGSGIIQAAHSINSGEMLSEKTLGEEFYFIEEEDPQTIKEKIIELVTQRIPAKFGIQDSDVQVLSPMYKGVLGIDQLNLDLQAKVNPQPRKRLKRGDFFWGLGDRVVVLKNNYEKEIFNGDLGNITSMSLEDEELVVSFDRGHRVKFSFDELNMLSLAYALSVHKSQGSEFGAIVLPLSTQHYRMLRRKLIYTAVTRAKKLCVLVGSRKAFQIAITNFQEQPRYTALKERITGGRISS
jgi:exodeoxyribonuclease V alpha subunit